MAAHTKGPWEITQHGTLIQQGGNENRPIEVAGINIAHFSRYEAPAHQIANARLIAAAPDLLEACAEFVRKCDSGEARSTRSYNQMKAALAKARGE